MNSVDVKIYSQANKTPYQVWLEKCNERDYLEKLLPEVIENLGLPNPTKVIDIGCGVGSAAQRLRKVMNNQGIKMLYTGIDPYQEQLDFFAKNDNIIENKKLIRSSLEELDASNKFDLAYAVHSLYYTDSIEDSVKKLKQLGDKVLIVHHGKNGINTIHEAFPEYVRKVSKNVISIYSDIIKTLEYMGIEYNIMEATSQVDITTCKDAENETGRKLLSFFLEDTDLSEDIYKEVSSWIKNSLPDIIPHQIGIIYF